MEFIKNDDLNNIFKNISDRKPKTNNNIKGSEKNMGLITSGIFDTKLLDNGLGQSNRTHPGVLHQDLLATLETNKDNSSSNKYLLDKNKKYTHKNKCTPSPFKTFSNSSNTNILQDMITHPLVSNSITQEDIDNDKIIITDNDQLITDINIENNLNLSPYKCPDDELHQVLYYLVSSIIPEFSSYGKELRLKYYKNLREKMAYDLDERDLYHNYSYKRLFNKTEIQNKLLSCKPIYDKWLLMYLSDYFDINICQIHEKLVFLTNEYKNRPTILLTSCNRSIKTYVNNGITLHPASLGDIICKKSDYIMTEFKSISKYKLDELQQIASSLNIPITNQSDKGKIKNRKKDDMYSDIKNKIQYW